MINSAIEWFQRNEKTTLFFLVLIFVAIRLPGIDLPLHQDEYKWPMIVNPAYHSETSIPHPPLSQFIYRTAGYVVGFNTNFRLVPLFFGTINLVLLYWLMRILFGKKEAVIASLIWIFSYFSILSSLMVDTDGEILPLFFILSLIFYQKFLKSYSREKYIWGALLGVSFILGFFVKVSFIIAIGSIFADFIWLYRKSVTKRTIIITTAVLFGSAVFLVSLLYVATFIFPFFDLSASVKYWEHFFVGNRGWFQTLIQCIKAVLYTSPFLLLVPMMGKKEWFYKVKSLIFFLFFSFIFYVVIFDFSLGALDRYLQLLVFPLTVLSSVVVVRIYERRDHRSKEFLYLGIITSLLLVMAQSLSHYVPPLHPKSDWINRILHLKWNFLYPFSGGSGPLGFYVSFLFIALAWVATLFPVCLALYKPAYKKAVLFFIIPFGIVYNGIFLEEYLFGTWNGSAPRLLNQAVEYIKNNPDIKMVTAYNDNGGNELQQIGKYRKRLYVDPKFDINDKVKTLNQYKEHYFVLDVPRINYDSIYQKYFDSCNIIYKKQDKKMSATIYDCRKAPNIKVN